MQSTKDLQKIAEAYGGIPIWGCVPGSPCHRAGVTYGDILLEVNGLPTGSIEAYTRARRKDDENFSARILRRGEEFEVTVPVTPVDGPSEFAAMLTQLVIDASSDQIGGEIN